MAFVCFWLDNAFNCVFMLIEVDNFIDYANSIFIITASTGISTCFTIAVIKTIKLFELIDFAQRITDCGKCRIRTFAHLKHIQFMCLS